METVKMLILALLLVLLHLSFTCLARPTRLYAYSEGYGSLILSEPSLNRTSALKAILKVKQLDGGWGDCVATSRAVLMLSWLGTRVPEDSVEYILACYRGSGFAANPVSGEVGLEETFYALWALRELGLLGDIDAGKVEAYLEGKLRNSSRLVELYYSYMGLRLLGHHYNVSGRLGEYYRLDGGFAETPKTLKSDPYSTFMGIELAKLSSFNRSSKTLEYARRIEDPALKALVLDLLGGLSEAEARNLANKILEGDLGFWEVYALRVLSEYTFSVSVVVEPKAVVYEIPKIVSLKAYSLLGEKLNASYASRFYDNGTLVVRVEASGIERKLSFSVKRLGKMEVYATIVSGKGLLNVTVYVSPSYANPDVIVALAGKEYRAVKFREDAYRAVVEHGLRGRFPITVVAFSEGYGYAEARGEVNLEPPDLGEYLSPVPLVTALGFAPVVLGAVRDRRKKLRALASSTPPIAFFALAPIASPDVVRAVGGLAAYGVVASAAVLASVALAAGVSALKRAVEWILVVGLVLVSTVLSGNPLLVVVAGIGLGVFALTIWLYPSTWSGGPQSVVEKS